MAVYTGHEGNSQRVSRVLISSRFYIMHPAVILLYYIGAFSYVFLYFQPLFLLTNCAFLMALAFYYRGKRKTLSALLPLLLISLSFLVLNLLLNHRGEHILFYLLDKPITLEAGFYGLCSMLLVISMFIAFISFNALLDGERFLYLFARALPKTAFIVSMALRYASIFKKRAIELAQVRKIRKSDDNSAKLPSKIKNTGHLLMTLVTWSLEEGMQTAEALKAKGYGSGKRSLYRSYHFTFKNGCLMIIGSALLVASYGLSFMGAGQYQFYPRLSALTMSGTDWAAYWLMIIFLALPLILEIRAAIQRSLAERNWKAGINNCRP